MYWHVLVKLIWRGRKLDKSNKYDIELRRSIAY